MKTSLNTLGLLILATGALLVAMGAMVLAGWHTGWTALVQAHPDWVPVRYKTALALLLAGGSLLLVLVHRLRAAAALGAITALMGLFSLSQRLLAVDPGIDELFIQHGLAMQAPQPWRMPPNTALGFLLAGTGLALNGWLREQTWVPVAKAALAALVLGLGLVALSGYLIGLPAAYGWGALTQMAIQVSLGLLILGVGLLALAWRRAIELQMDPFAWLPIPAGIAVLTIALLLWQALSHALQQRGVEDLQLQSLVLAFGGALALALSAALYQLNQSRNRTEAAERAQHELAILATQHRQAEQALGESEALLQATSSLASVGGWELDPGTQELACTRETQRILGLPPGIEPPLEEAIGLFHPDDRPLLRHAIDEAIENGTPYDLELRLTRTDGTEIWTRATCQPEMVDGEVVRLRGAFQDIHDRKQFELRLATSQRLLEIAERVGNVGGWEVDLDAGLVHWSDQVARIHGLPQARSIPVDQGIDHYAPEYRDRIRAVFSACVEDGIPFDEELQIIDAQGHRVWVRSIGEPVFDETGTVRKVEGAFQDISARKRNEAALLQAAMVFDHTQDGIIVTDPDTCIVSVNRAFTEITGYTRAEALGQKPASLIQSSRHPPSFYRAMWKALNTSGYWQGEIWNRRKNGEEYPEWLTVNAVQDANGETTHYIGIFTDITDIKQSQERLEYLAHYDTLTDLPNRTLFEFKLDKAIEHSKRHGERIAVLIIDLDRFKAINDSLGHSVGDELLAAIPKRLALRLRGEDTFARLGGDEFALLLGRIEHPEDAGTVAHDIISHLAAPFSLPSGHEVFIGASIGISVFPNDGSTMEEMMRNADSAMFEAKDRGRNHYHFYTEDLTLRAVERLSLENRLRRALSEQEFELHYQPFIRIADGRVVGAEALLRWRDPEQGLIPPSAFIDVAEDSGLIAGIGEQVLRDGCRQMKAWRDEGVDLDALAINLSAQQFLLQDVPEVVRGILAETGLPAQHLELELTETTFFQQGQASGNTLETLRALGLRLSIDDFGTGYSSLAYLQQFPLDKLKIDARFIRDLLARQDSRELTAAIITMGHGLGLEVLAEGVETEGHLDLLRRMGCDTYQGYLAARPQPAEQFAAWLRRHPGAPA
ncbi:sensor domain-containing protein [Thioalkalivibrio thiocyanoxidans]|uniref:sensor domain-containing protein n=1 Tax=Thioalkalivibrio thiocyanoxidans TaxID=152475 RepID=UPI00037B15F5|nr:EAL domain-containing protein [Thioalkalivibrio thiocyanoxidans]